MTNTEITISTKKFTDHLERRLRKVNIYTKEYGNDDIRTKYAVESWFACVDMVESFGFSVIINEDGTVTLGI